MLHFMVCYSLCYVTIYHVVLVEETFPLRHIVTGQKGQYYGCSFACELLVLQRFFAGDNAIVDVAQQVAEAVYFYAFGVGLSLHYSAEGAAASLFMSYYNLKLLGSITGYSTVDFAMDSSRASSLFGLRKC